LRGNSKESAAPRGNQNNDDDDVTEDDEEEDNPPITISHGKADTASATSSSSSSENEAPKHRKPITVKIGGKRTSPSLSPRKINRRIGRVKHHDDDNEGKEKLQKKEVAQEPVKEPVKVLTAEEKALERRVAMKRELEEKKRQGVKKMKRF
jgi:hypothetical protein